MVTLFCSCNFFNLGLLTRERAEPTVTAPIAVQSSAHSVGNADI